MDDDRAGSRPRLTPEYAEECRKKVDRVTAAMDALLGDQVPLELAIGAVFGGVLATRVMPSMAAALSEHSVKKVFLAVDGLWLVKSLLRGLAVDPGRLRVNTCPSCNGLGCGWDWVEVGERAPPFADQLKAAGLRDGGDVGRAIRDMRKSWQFRGDLARFDIVNRAPQEGQGV